MGRRPRGAGWCLGLLIVSGCQETVDLAMRNDCSEAIEVDTNIREAKHIVWQTVQVGHLDVVRSAEEDFSDTYVWVRAAGSDDAPEPFRVERGEFLDLPADRFVLVISGARCP